ncbi:MAG TPA: OmpA family protein [Bacteroidia bacterium]|nr:OmpA family protein [Bacteroidia bacterium]
MRDLKFVVCCFISFVCFELKAQVSPDSTAAPVIADSLNGVKAVSPENQGSEGIPGQSISPLPVDSSAPEPVKTSKAPKTAGSRALQKANLMYSQQAFAEAIPYYEKARKTDPANKLLLSNLAECYRLTSNIEGQINTYGALVEMGASDPLQELYYGEALQQHGDNIEAKIYFDKYNKDARGKELASSFHKNKEFLKNVDAYSLTPSSFNSAQSDMCAIKYYDVTVFASARGKASWIKHEHAWTNSAYLKMYATRKDGHGKELKPILFMSDLNSKYNDGPISFTRDFNMLYFSRNNVGKDDKSKDGVAKYAILMAYLDENGFSEVELMPFDNVQYNYTHPSISPDGYTLFFSSDMPGGYGGMDIYRVKKDSLGVWGKVENMGEKVNTAGNELFPYFSPDSVFYFASNGHIGLGGLDLYEAKMKNGQVSRIYNMGMPINTQYDDFGLYICEDLKNGFISSNRKAGDMDDDIYDLQILRKVKRGKDATILLRDKNSGEPADSLHFIVNGDTVMSNEKGEYALTVEDDENYKIVFNAPGYFPLMDSLNSESSPEEIFTRELVVEKDPHISVQALFTDAATKEALDSVSIRITDINTSYNYATYLTGDSGIYRLSLPEKRIGDKLAYLIRLDKPGYLHRNIVFTHDISQAGVVDLNQSLNLSMGRIQVGMDLAKMIDLKPIYFDLGKATIRPDAATELDKIVQVMNEYPGMYIELGSHTDCRSSAKSNLKLSDERAKASAAYIVKKGIKKARIVGKGYGESKLLNNCACEGKVESNCTEEEHSINRRTEFIITKLK